MPNELNQLRRKVVDLEQKLQQISMDVSERRQAEAALKESHEYLIQIINHIGDPIFVKDREHRLVLVNDAMCSFRGRPREELLGQASMPEDIAASLWQQEEEVLRTGREYLSEEIFDNRQDGSITMLTRKSRLTDKNGNHQIVGILRDITEHKRLESQFLQSQKMEAVGILTGGIAHDFNNILNVINGYSEVMMDELAQNNPMYCDLEQIRNAGQRAAALIAQLLAFSRKQVLQPEILDLNAVIDNISTMLHRVIGEDIELITNMQPDLGMVNADPGKIQQVLMNLAVNARDAMPQGGKLILETENVYFDEQYMQNHPIAKPGAYTMLAVSDNGIGMDVETQAHIFEPFFTTKEKGKGTGLGLSTIYGIVKQSFGFIWVDSEPGKGTTFKIYLPRAEGQGCKMPIERPLEDTLTGVQRYRTSLKNDTIRHRLKDP